MSLSNDQNTDRQMVDDTERWLERRGVPVADLRKEYFKGVDDDAREALAVPARYGGYVSRPG